MTTNTEIIKKSLEKFKLVVGIEKIKPYEKNPRNNDSAVEPVANLINEVGWKQAIVVDRDYVIICGHTRLKAAKKLNLAEVPIIVADDLTPEQVRLYRIADNRVSEFSEWNDLLEQEIRELEASGLKEELSSVGFDEDYLEELLSSAEKEKDEPEESMPEDLKLKELKLTERMQKANYVFFSFSGGRDSTRALMATWETFQKTGKHCEVLYVDNRMEFPDLIMHIRRVCKMLNAKLTCIPTEKDVYTEYCSKGKWPNHMFMDCVQELINMPMDKYCKSITNGEDYIMVRGGQKKQKTRLSKTDKIVNLDSKPNMLIYNPLFELTEEQLALPIPEWRGYELGFERTACWACPFQKKTQWAALKQHYPFLFEELKDLFRTVPVRQVKGDSWGKTVSDYWAAEGVDVKIELVAAGDKK